MLAEERGAIIKDDLKALFQGKAGKNSRVMRRFFLFVIIGLLLFGVIGVTLNILSAEVPHDYALPLSFSALSNVER